MSVAPSPQFYDPFYRWEVRARPDDFSLLGNVHFVKPRHLSSSEDAARPICVEERSAEPNFKSAASFSSDLDSNGNRLAGTALHAGQFPPFASGEYHLSVTEEDDVELIQNKTKNVTDCPPVLLC